MSAFHDIPFGTSRWRIAVLRVIFRRRWWVQVRGVVYILRPPVSDEPLNDAQMDRAIKRSERENWKDIIP